MYKLFSLKRSAVYTQTVSITFL